MKSLSVVLLLLVVWQGTAHAASDGVACVQRQLALLDHDPGADSGALTPATGRAYAAFATADVDGVLPPTLSARQALAVCRALGARSYELRAAWPAHRAPLRIDAAPGVAPHTLEGLRAALNRGLPALSRGGVVGLAGPVVVTVGVERADFLLRAPSRDRDAVAAGLLRHCGSEQDVGVFRVGDRLHVCLAYRDIRLGRAHLRQPDPEADARFARVMHLLHIYLMEVALWQLVSPAEGASLSDTVPETFVFAAAAWLAWQHGGVLPVADRLAACRAASSQWQRVTWLAEDGQFMDVASKVGLGAAWRDAFRDVFGGDWAALSCKLPLTVE